MIFHSLADAVAAVAAADGRPLILLSARGAAGYAGPDFLKAITDNASAGAGHVEAAIDCGPDAGVAMAALRGGWKHLIFRGDDRVRTKLADMAAQMDAKLDDTAPDALDLLDVASGYVSSDRLAAGAPSHPQLGPSSPRAVPPLGVSGRRLIGV